MQREPAKPIGFATSTASPKSHGKAMVLARTLASAPNAWFANGRALLTSKAAPSVWQSADRRTRYGMPPGLQAEVPDMRGLYPRFVRVLLPVSLPVQPRYHKTLQRNSGLLEGTLHLRSPTDRVDVERPAAIWLCCCVLIVQRIEPNLRHRCEHAGLPEIGKVRFAISQSVPVGPEWLHRNQTGWPSPAR